MKSNENYDTGTLVVMSFKKMICMLREGMTETGTNSKPGKHRKYMKGIFKRISFCLGIGSNIRGRNIRT